MGQKDAGTVPASFAHGFRPIGLQLELRDANATPHPPIPQNVRGRLKTPDPGSLA